MKATVIIPIDAVVALTKELQMCQLINVLYIFWTNQKVAGSIPASVIGFLIDIKFFRSHYGPGVHSASNRNEYQEHFLGVKAAET